MASTTNQGPERKKYSTEMGVNFPRVRLIADPEVVAIPQWANGADTGKTQRALRCKFVKETRSKRHMDYFVEVTVDLERRPFLAKLRKGDYVTIADADQGLELRLFTSNGKNAFNGVGLAAEIKFPRVFTPQVDLRERPEPAGDGEAGEGTGVADATPTAGADPWA